MAYSKVKQSKLYILIRVIFINFIYGSFQNKLYYHWKCTACDLGLPRLA